PQTFRQTAAPLALDQGRAGQEAKPQPEFVAMMFREFDGLGLCIESHGVILSALSFEEFGPGEYEQAAASDHCPDFFKFQVIGARIAWNTARLAGAVVIRISFILRIGCGVKF